MANFAPHPGARHERGPRIRSGSKIEVPVTILNNGGAAALSCDDRHEEGGPLDGKAANERTPIVLGNIAAGGSAETSLTFTGVKAGTRTLQLTLTYTDGTATLSTQVTVP